MAENSYPFEADNASGGKALVSQVQWQAMALGWGGDYVDFRMTTPGEVLPFVPTISNGRDVGVGSGRAWVGGFYYENTSSKTFTISNNPTSQGRKDLIVIRANMATSSVNLALVTGTPSTNPVPPAPIRTRGGIWDLALHEVDAPANNGAITVSRRAPFNMPQTVAFPWNAEDSARLLPLNAFGVDADSNSSGGQQEVFQGHDGFAVTRHLGKSRSFTPNLLYGGSATEVAYLTGNGNFHGRWRWVAPNLYHFRATMDNVLKSPIEVVSGQWRLAITLPVATHSKGIQTLHGFLSNPNKNSGVPNMTSVTATTHPKSTTLFLHVPNFKTPTEGLDGLRVLPADSTLSISGVLEANEFNE